jgi:hypothetical protein
MTETTIHQIVGIQGVTLLVFFTEALCLQFRLISSGGAVFGDADFTTRLKRLRKPGEIGLHRGCRRDHTAGVGGSPQLGGDTIPSLPAGYCIPVTQGIAAVPANVEQDNFW